MTHYYETVPTVWQVINQSAANFAKEEAEALSQQFETLYDSPEKICVAAQNALNGFGEKLAYFTDEGMVGLLATKLVSPLIETASSTLSQRITALVDSEINGLEKESINAKKEINRKIRELCYSMQEAHLGPLNKKFSKKFEEQIKAIRIACQIDDSLHPPEKSTSCWLFNCCFSRELRV